MSLLPRLLALVAAALLPALLIQIRAEHDARGVRERLVHEEALRLARVVVAEHRHIAEGARQLLTALGKAPALREGDTDGCRGYSVELLRAFPRYAAISAAGLDGRVICTARPNRAGQDVADRAWFRDALATDGFVTGEHIVGRGSGRPSLSFSQPWRDAEGLLAGVVVAAIDLDWLERELARLPLPAGATVFVLDRNGIVLARSPAATGQVGQPAPERLRALFAGSAEGSEISPGLDGVPRVVGHARLQDLPGGIGVAVGLDAALAFAGAETAGWRGLVMIATGILLALLLIAIGARRLVWQPTAALLEAAERWRAGDLAARVGTRAGARSEFGRLGRAFDTMAGAIAAREAALAGQATRQALLLDILHALLEAHGRDEAALAALVLEGAAPHLGAEVGLSYALAEDGEVLHLVAAPGLPAQYLPRMRRLKPGEGYCAVVAATALPMEEDSGGIAGDRDAELARELGVSAYACHPLLGADGRVLGTLAFASTSREAFGAEDAALMRALAHLLALAWQRRRAEAQLRDGEAFLRSVLDSSTDCVKVIEPDGTLAFVNSGGRALLELEDCVSLEGRCWAELWPEPGRAQVEAAIATALAGRTARFEGFAPTARGTPKWWDVAVSPVRDAEGQVTRVVATSRDVSERRAAEAALAASEATLQAVLDALPVGVVVADAEGRLVRDNAAHREVWDAPQRAGSAAGCVDWVGLRPETGTRLAAEEWPIARAALRGERVRDELVEFRRAGTGERRFVLNNAAPVRDAEGRIVGGVVAELDITDRRRAEAALAESEACLKLFIERAPAAIAMFDTGMRYMALSRRFLRDYGFPAELQPADVVGRGHYELFPEIPERWRAAHRRVLAGETLSADEDGFPRPDGRTDWVRWEMVPWRRPDGTVGGALLFSELVTHRVEADRALADSEGRLRLALEAGRMGIFDWDLVQDRLSWDARTFDLFGLAPSAGQPGSAAVLDRVHPEDRPGLDAAIGAAIAEGVFSHEFRLCLPGGAVRWIGGYGRTVRDDAGRPVRMVGLNFDITDRRSGEDALARSEGRFRAAVQAVSGIVWTINAAGEMEGEQPGWAALTGQRLEDYQGHGWARAVHPEDAGPTIAAWKAALAARRPLEFEHRVCRADHVWRRFAVRAIPVLRADGTVLEWVGVHTDVTERREAEAVLARDKADLEALVESRTAALRESEARLAQAAKMEALGRLAGGVAHDFNNVLQAVQGGIVLASKRLKRDPEGAQRFLELAGDATERGAAVTGRLLAFARRGELESIAIAPAPLLEGLAQLLRHTLGPAVTLAVEAPAGLPALLADAGQLEAVLVNLANNARDALPKDGGRITLSAAAGQPGPPHLPPGDYLRISVADDGQGMTPEVLARVTEPFFTTKPKGKGTGLGLAMARGFAEQSGGALTIESTPGAGTRVSVWLPRAPALAAGAAQAETGPAAPPAGRRAALLVVDDEAEVRAVLAAGLAEQGHVVAEAEDGAAALARLDEGVPVQALVTDLAMPGGMDGLALVRLARRRRPGLPAVLVTGHVGDAGRFALEEAAGSGPFAILRKPVSIEAVAAQVTLLLEEAGTRARPQRAPVEAG